MELADSNTKLDYGQRLAQQRYYHAALEVWQDLLSSQTIDPDSRGLILDNIGDIHRQLGDYSTALSYCSDAAQTTTNSQHKVMFLIHVAVIHRRLSDIDRASRLLMDTIGEYEHQLDYGHLGRLYLNLGMVQGAAGFYAECLEYMTKALKYFQQADMSFAYPTLYNNLGLFYLETGEYEKAEEYLFKTLELFGEPDLALSLDLSRVYFRGNRFADGAKYLRQSLSSIWTSVMDYSKEDIAQLCQLLATVAYNSGDAKTAMRLIEKAQLFAGQIGQWRQWEEIQTTIDQWTEQGDVLEPKDYHISVKDVQQFLSLMDILNGQEFLNKQFSRILDTRVIYAEVLSEAMNLSKPEQQYLVYACRFADYGLTALEMEVIENPKRSSHTWEQFTQHPELSVSMLEILNLPSDITSIILDHHENFDGSGYPNQKQGDEISLLARIFAVIAQYTWGVTNKRKSHSETIQEIKKLSGTEFDPNVVETFENMFQI
jgi:response regulator RpfG family c-di-GMP phosphodiesterase